MILATIATLQAIAVLSIALVALVLTLSGYMPTPPAEPTVGPKPIPAPPMVHPTIQFLESLPVRDLRTLAGTRSKRYRKPELITMAGAAMAC